MMARLGLILTWLFVTALYTATACMVCGRYPDTIIIAGLFFGLFFLWIAAMPTQTDSQQ